jgi:uncharacterized iron-regulated membrane protein
VYRQELANLLEPPPRVSAETGKPHTVAQVIAAARARIGKEFTPFLYEAPTAPGQPTTLRLMALGDAVKGRRVIGVLVDPVSLDLVSWRYEAFSGFLRVLVGLHGNLLMGRAGRVYVGSLGLAVPVLGISGLIPWWPGRSRWRAAFLVKRGAGSAPVPRPAPRARHLDLCRGHGRKFQQSISRFSTVGQRGHYGAAAQPRSRHPYAACQRRGGPMHRCRSRDCHRTREDPRRSAYLDRPPAADRAARAALWGLLARPGAGRGAPEVAAVINPWSGELIDPRRFPPAQTVLAWQQALHFGEGLGWVWRILVCLSGLLPAIFAFTGLAMWLITQSAPGAPLSRSLDQSPRPNGPAMARLYAQRV